MKPKFHFLAIFILFFAVFVSSGQTTIKISKPRLKIENNNLIISYDILNSKPGEKFKIWIEVTDSTGKPIEAQSLSGDVGDDVAGGSDKEIIWNLFADRIFLDVGIYIQINADVIGAAEGSDKKTEPRTIKRSSAILQSLVFPGLGLSRMSNGKPHWIRGVAGYGCIAASIVYNRKAIESYDKYQKSDDPQEIDEFYDNSVKEDKLSEAFTYAAIGIWVTDFVWTMVGSSRIDKEKKLAHSKGFSISTKYNLNSNIPMLMVTYSF